jgi:curved DNA-binding protein CbpA
MSAPLAGKFQDHYEVLGIDPKTALDIIQEVYPGLAQKYHPKNAETGDEEKFEAVNLAYEVLSDPVLRKEFDKIKGIGNEETIPKFSGLDFFVSLGREACLRSAILCVLYDRRRSTPSRPSLSMRHMEMILSATTDEIFFALWYLKERHLVGSDDKSSLQISAEGMDFLEANRPSPEIVMPLIKQAAVAPRKFPAEAILHVASAPDMVAAMDPMSLERNPLELRPVESPVAVAPGAVLPVATPERVATPEASSALKALREALTSAASRVAASR